MYNNKLVKTKIYKGSYIIINLVDDLNNMLNLLYAFIYFGKVRYLALSYVYFLHVIL